MPMLRDVMTAEPVSVTPQSSLREVINLLCEYHVSGVPVVSDSGRLLGVISATDIIDFLAGDPGVPVQAADPAWLRPDDGLDQEGEDPAAAFFLDQWSDGGDQILGQFGASGAQTSDLLESFTAEELMTRRIVALGSSSDVAQAARLMLDEGIHRLLVVDDGLLKGVVTTKDLIRLVARARDERLHAVFHAG